MKFDTDLLDRLVTDGWITRQKHPDADLYIYNYAPKTQFARNWTPETLACRGLILDKRGNVVARPFPKFFNIEEVKRSDLVWKKPFTVHEKVDGSLGILYMAPDGPALATRGSFSSDQAKRGTAILRDRHLQWAEDVLRSEDVTFLFEIIYKENRIVVDYEGAEALILLAVLDNETGGDRSTDNYAWNGRKAKTFDLAGAPVTPRNIAKHFQWMEEDGQEGFVLRFDYLVNGANYRMKIKFDEYKRLHQLMTGTNSKIVWEYLSQGWEITDLLEKVPDEFYAWVSETVDDLNRQYAAVNNAAHEMYEICSTDPTVRLGGRKEFALKAMSLPAPFPSLMFTLYDEDVKKYERLIWNSIKPAYERPFWNRSKVEDEL